MTTMLTWCARNRVAANFFMLMIFMAGFTSVAKIQRELFPQVSLDTVSVSVLYPGATPVEVEEGIVLRIEEAISGLEGIEEIQAIAAEGLGTVNVKVEPGYQTSALLNQIKTRVDAISTFPIDAEKPVVEELTSQIRVINVVISSDAVDELTLHRLADRARDELLSLEGITQVQYGGLRPYEIAIHVSEAALRRHGLTFDEVAAAVRRSSLDLPAGAIRAGSGDILLRTRSQAYRGHEFENLVVLARPDGTRLLLKDLAEVVDGFDENEQWARFNGRPAAMLSVMSAKNQNVTDTAAAVHAYVKQAAERLPEEVRIDTWFDMSRWYVERQDLMLRNGLTGLVLVFLALSLFMHLRLAFWVASGMAVAFVGTFAVMIVSDVSFNMISMAAFILVLGIVVDDAIVVAEAVHHWHSRGSSGTDGAVAGVIEVATPVIFAVLTTVIAFMPMLAISGVDGKFWRAIPIVIISCLLISLAESLFILPAHLSHTPGHKIPWYLLPIWPVVWFSEQAQERADRSLQWFIDRVYRPLLDAAVSWRYLTLAVFVGMLILMVGLVAGGRVRSAFFPRIPGDYATAALEMPEGTSAADTRKVLLRIEAAAGWIQRKLDDEQPGKLPVFQHVLVAMGSQPVTRAHDSMEGNL
ncbi:MAG: efflux RND transporter permease subunit, partial [Rhodopirellula sp.]|nr:efflux RND transporter permease subunit [Rhodopirellula sp.]